MYRGFVRIDVDPIGDPDGSKLEKVLNLHLAYEPAEPVQRRWTWIAALVWSVTLISSQPSSSHPLIAALRDVIALRAVIAWVNRWHLHRRWNQALLEYPAARGSYEAEDR
jgi:hypothetical protein